MLYLIVLFGTSFAQFKKIWAQQMYFPNCNPVYSRIKSKFQIISKIKKHCSMIRSLGYPFDRHHYLGTDGWIDKNVNISMSLTPESRLNTSFVVLDNDAYTTSKSNCLLCRLDWRFVHKPIIVTKIRSYSTSCTKPQTDNIFKPSGLTHTVFPLYSTAVYLHHLCLLFLSFWEAPGRE